MKISIIAVSNSEIVSSEKNDTISQISSTLHKNGQEVVSLSSVRAQSDVVQTALDSSLDKSDCVLMLCSHEVEKLYMCKKLLCEKFDCQMIVSSFAKFNIEEFSRLQVVPMTKEDSAYAQMPEIARTIKNSLSAFQGCLIEKDGKIVFLLPIVHDELYHMFFSSVLPYILKLVGNNSSTYVFKTFGIKNAELHSLLRDYTRNKLNIEVVCSEYLLSGEVVLNVPKSTRKDYAENFVKGVYEKILPYVYADKDESLAEYIFSMLSIHYQKLSFAEDFTAGNMCATLFETLDNAGEILSESCTTSSNESKTKILGVDAEILKRQNKDYAEIAYQMALGSLENSGADVVVSNCGDIESGELTFAIGTKEGVHIFNRKTDGNRKQKIIMATNAIFFELAKKLKKNDFALGRTVL